MNKDNRLASFLTTLLCACIVAEASLGTYVGLKLFMAKQEQEFENARYEAYLEEQEQRRENPQMSKKKKRFLLTPIFKSWKQMGAKPLRSS